MEVSIPAIVEVLNGVENSLKEVVKKSVNPELTSSFQVIPYNIDYLRGALEDVQSAITELLQIR